MCSRGLFGLKEAEMTTEALEVPPPLGPIRLILDAAAVTAAARAGHAPTACATTAAQHSAKLTASNSAASQTVKAPSPRPAAEVTDATQTAAQALPAAGNPNGHALVPRVARGEHQPPQSRHPKWHGRKLHFGRGGQTSRYGRVISFNGGPKPVPITMT
jgi:hypothetical protein